MDFQDIIAILIATIPNLIIFLGNRNTSKSNYEHVSAQTIKEYANQVREMRKELQEVYANEKKWKDLYEEAQQQLEWTTEYIDRLCHQIKSLGHEPVEPRQNKKEKK